MSYGRRSGCGCLSSVVSLVMALVVLAVVLVAAIPTSCAKGSRTTTDASHSSTITRQDESTSHDNGTADSDAAGGSGVSAPMQTDEQIAAAASKRQKLAADKCVLADDWLEDQAGWLDNEQSVIEAERNFYELTGVQPYLVIADEVNGSKSYASSDVETYLRTRYDELFGDDGHLILFFCEAYENEYDPYLLVGSDAQEVIDEAAENLIYEAVDRWYTDSSLTDDEYFARIFQASSDAIMNGTSFLEYQ